MISWSFLLCLICLGFAAVVVQFFNDRPANEYFGFAFPQRPGRLVAMALSFALLAVLLIVHALIKVLSSRGGRT